MSKDNCGMINNIDEMGRVEIPREFRKILDLKEGARIELGIFNNQIIISKYLPMKTLNEWGNAILNAISSVIDHDIILTDDKKAIHSSKKKYISKLLSNECQEIIYKREIVIKKQDSDSNMINIFTDIQQVYTCELIVPIIKDNNILGSIIVLAEQNKCFDDDTVKVCKAFANFLSSVIN